MCFCKTIYNSAGCAVGKLTAKIAESDIPVYKILHRTALNEIVSPFRSEYYFDADEAAESIHKAADFSVDHENANWLGRGLHSYTTLDCARKHLENMFGGCFIVRAVIPKGAMYYMNDRDHTAISTELVVETKEIKR